MKITKEIVNDLGEGYLTIDGDTAYLYSPAWLIVWVGAVRDLSPDILELEAQAAERRGALDWRILAAEEIDMETERFMLRGDVHVHEVFASPSWYGKANNNVDMLRFRADLAAMLMYQAGLDLSSMFETGHARPVYPSGRGVRKKLAAEDYQFRFELDGVQRVAVVDGGMMRGLHQLGFSLQLCVHAERSEKDDLLPPISFSHTERTTELFGSMGLRRESGILKTPDGRMLFNDAARICWYTEEEALALLRDPSMHNPAIVDFGEPLEDLVAQRASRLYGGNEQLRLAVGILRWQGWTDNDIESVYMEQREPALVNHIIPSLHERIRVLRKDFLSHRGSHYGGTRAMRIHEQVKELCSLFDEIQGYLGEEVDLGELPSLVQESAPR